MGEGDRIGKDGERRLASIEIWAVGYRDYGLRRAPPPPAHSSDCPTRSRHRGVAVLAHCLFLSSLRRFLTIVLFMFTLNMLSSACHGPTQDAFSPVACDESSVSQQTFSHLRVPLTQLILAVSRQVALTVNEEYSGFWVAATFDTRTSSDTVPFESGAPHLFTNGDVPAPSRAEHLARVVCS